MFIHTYIQCQTYIHTYIVLHTYLHIYIVHTYISADYIHSIHITYIAYTLHTYIQRYRCRCRFGLRLSISHNLAKAFLRNKIHRKSAQCTPSSPSYVNVKGKCICQKK